MLASELGPGQYGGLKSVMCEIDPEQLQARLTQFLEASEKQESDAAAVSTEDQEVKAEETGADAAEAAAAEEPAEGDPVANAEVRAMQRQRIEEVLKSDALDNFYNDIDAIADSLGADDENAGSADGGEDAEAEGGDAEAEAPAADEEDMNLQLEFYKVDMNESELLVFAEADDVLGLDDEDPEESKPLPPPLEF
jgi:hypothetical protein